MYLWRFNLVISKQKEKKKIVSVQEKKKKFRLIDKEFLGSKMWKPILSLETMCLSNQPGYSAPGGLSIASHKPLAGGSIANALV